MTFWPLIVFWVVAVAGLRGSPAILLYALFAAIPFASLAVVPPELTGGLSLTPATVVALLIVIKCVAGRDGRHWVALACTTPSMLTPLVVFWLVAVLTTLFAPHFFAGEVEIIPLRGELDETSLLAPSMQQFSQLGYMSVSVFAVIACARLLQPPEMRQHALRAMALGAALLCVTGLLDWIAQDVDLDWLLAPLRTATYAIATDSRIAHLDMKRLSGVTPEPSVFGSLCVTYLATLWFFRRTVRDRWLRGASFVLYPCLIAMIFMSTSTTAYVGFALLLVVGVAEAVWRLLSSRRRTLERRMAWSHNRRLAAVALGITLAFVALPGASAYLAEAVDTIVLKKTESGSFEQRTMWTAVSLQSAVETKGFGVGLGGTRASNSAVAMLSNVGVLGTLLYIGFVATTYLRQPAKRAADGTDWMTAYRWSVPPIVALGLMSSATADFGPYLALLFGSTVSLQKGARVERLLADANRAAEAMDGRRRTDRRRSARRRAGGYVMPRSSRRPVGAAKAPAALEPAPGFPAAWPVAAAGGLDMDLGSPMRRGRAPEASGPAVDPTPDLEIRSPRLVIIG